MVGALSVVAGRLATPPSGVTTITFGVGRFDDIDSTTKTDINSGAATDFWQARINTKGASDLYVLQNTIAARRDLGWHSHPGPSLVIVKSGTATFYMADDPPARPMWCRPEQGFVDNGHDTHVVRNEGSVDLVTVVVSLRPGRIRKADRRAGARQLPRPSKRLIASRGWA